MEAAFSLPVKLILMSTLPIALGLVCAAIVFFLRMIRKISSAWFVAAMSTTSLIAVSAAVFPSTWHAIDTFQTLAMMGGGSAAASAGLWESGHPLLFALYASILIAAITLIAITLQPNQAQNQELEPRSEALPLIVLPIVSIALAFVPLALFHSTSRLLFEVLSPSFAPSSGGAGGLALLAQKISSRLMLCSVMSLLITALLVAIMIVSALAGRRAPAHRASKLAFLPLILVVVFLLVQLMQLQSRMSALKQTAMSGQFPTQQR